jgi:hypothetical protein
MWWNKMYYEFIFKYKNSDQVMTTIILKKENKTYKELEYDAWNMLEYKSLAYLDEVKCYNKPRLSYAQIEGYNEMERNKKNE